MTEKKLPDILGRIPTQSIQALNSKTQNGSQKTSSLATEGEANTDNIRPTPENIKNAINVANNELKELDKKFNEVSLKINKIFKTQNNIYKKQEFQFDEIDKQISSVRNGENPDNQKSSPDEGNKILDDLFDKLECNENEERYNKTSDNQINKLKEDLEKSNQNSRNMIEQTDNMTNLISGIKKNIEKIEEMTFVDKLQLKEKQSKEQSNTNSFVKQ